MSLWAIIALIEAAALAICACVIVEYKTIIERQGRRLLEALDWIEPDKIVKGEWNDE